MTDYDSRRTGNGLLDTGSTPVWSTRRGRNELPSNHTDLIMKRRLGIMSFRFIIFGEKIADFV